MAPFPLCTGDARTAEAASGIGFVAGSGRGRWLLVLFGCLINVCLGGIYAYSVFRNPVQSLLQVSSVESGLPFTVFLVCDSLLMFFGGRLIDHHGPRKVGIFGGLLMGAGWILSGLLPRVVPSIWTLVLTYGVIGGSGVGLTYGVPLAVTTRWFPDRKGLAVGLTLAGFGGSPFVTANVARPLIEANGPLYTFTLMGVVFLVIVTALSAMLQLPAATRERPVGALSAPLRPSLAPRQMVGTATFWGLSLVYTIGCLAGLMAIGISSPMGTDVIRLEAATAASLVGVFALFNGAGRPLFGWLTDRISARWTAAISMLLICGASLLMRGAGSGMVIRYVGAFAVLWLCLGGWLSIGPTATATFFGVRNYARNYSYVYLGYGVAAIVSNLVAGKSLDLFGNYDVAFGITAALAAAGAAVAIAFVRPLGPAWCGDGDAS